MTMKKAVLFGAIAAVVIGGAFTAVRLCEKRVVDETPSPRLSRTGKDYRNQRPKEAVREAMNGLAPSNGRPNRPKRVPLDPEQLYAHLKGEDRTMAESLQKSLDEDDLNSTLAASEKALRSANAEVRLLAVEALGWFGHDALPELTEAMGDADEDVAEAAESAWELALSELDSADRRFSIAAAALATLGNEDHLISIVGQLSGAALEMIDGEDDEAKAAEKRLSVVQSLVDVMGSKYRTNIEQAEEAYEDITGHEWRGIDEAELYLMDPDNYELPEDREAAAMEEEESVTEEESEPSYDSETEPVEEEPVETESVEEESNETEVGGEEAGEGPSGEAEVESDGDESVDDETSPSDETWD